MARPGGPLPFFPQPARGDAHQRLPAGEPHFAHAFGDERAHQAVDLLEREQVLARQERG